MSDFILDQEGRFVEASNMEQYSRNLRSLLEDMRSGMNDEKQAVLDDYMETRFNREALNETLAPHWNALVGGWIGHEGSSRFMVSVPLEEEPALAPGIPEFMSVSLGSSGPCPCERISDDRDCVRLLTSGIIDLDSSQEAIPRWMKEDEQKVDEVESWKGRCRSSTME